MTYDEKIIKLVEILEKKKDNIITEEESLELINKEIEFDIDFSTSTVDLIKSIFEYNCY